MATHILHAMKELMHLGSVFPEANSRKFPRFFSKSKGTHSEKNDIEQEMRMQAVEERMQHIKARAFLQQF